MIKTYVVDTNVLIQAPYALNCFEDNQVVLPVVVLEELDNLKKAEGERGNNARTAIRLLEQLRVSGDLLKGVGLPGGGTLRVEKNFVDVKLPRDLPEEKADNRILKVCKGLSEQVSGGKEDERVEVKLPGEGGQPGEAAQPEEKGQVILVTKDILLRIKAQIIGIRAEDFTTEQVSDKGGQYQGRTEVYVPEDLFHAFKKNGIPMDAVYTADSEGSHSGVRLEENEFVILKADQSTKKTQLGRVENGVIRELEFKKTRPYGVSPRNAGQYFLQEALMQPASKAPLVIIKGMAGTSKTFYSLAVGLEKLVNNPNGEYRRILVSRPNAQFDTDIGFLPGTEQEKITPLMRPIIDNLEQLIDSNEEQRYSNEKELSDKIEELFDRGIIQAEALNYIRGRSIVKTYLIIDEAQNMTPNQVKGIITRAGKDTKIILLGDPNQIDRPYLDEKTNGLSYAAEYMKGSPLCWQLTMTAEECERSLLAMDAIRRL
ncbi:PhoH family protein [[Clostridium] symbiosum]|uniref:PhoH family protein n=1 Tax=Clostridium symbiosum TaxID=1512 RepID=UPI001D0867B9|nr:PhoH family protein [[Clostridium] symbiosum]MCB6611621.1 PhoH family protein [[Clostridium] symbiosum]MCB6933600.1 PhoH family protein [[Clostridium] symbiosum]